MKKSAMSERMDDCLLAEFVADYPEDDDRHIMARELIELRAKAEWRPIETAPKNGNGLVYMPTDILQPIQAARFHSNITTIGNHFEFDMEPPTHWMPLPPAPTSEKAP